MSRRCGDVAFDDISPCTVRCGSRGFAGRRLDPARVPLGRAAGCLGGVCAAVVRAVGPASARSRAGCRPGVGEGSAALTRRNREALPARQAYRGGEALRTAEAAQEAAQAGVDGGGAGRRRARLEAAARWYVLDLRVMCRFGGLFEVAVGGRLHY
jgi:hypothetical protein